MTLPDILPPVAREVSAEVAEPSIPGTSMTYLGGRPLRQYIVWYGLAGTAIAVVWGAVGSILLPNQIQTLEYGRWFTGTDARLDLTALQNLKAAVAGGTVATSEQQRQLAVLAQFDASRAQALALITALSTLLTMFVQPTVGVLSDRTRSAFGRRAPWILLGALLGAALLIGVRYAATVAVLGVFWVLASSALNLASPLGTTVADRVPASSLGTVSAVGGMGTFLGGVLGIVVAGALFTTLGLNLYLLISVVVVLGVLGFLSQARDRPSTTLSVPPHHWGEFFRGFLVPLRDSDFRLVWVARIVLLFGYATSTALSFFMLQSYIQPALSAAEATKTVPLLTLAALPGLLIAMAVSGRISDRVGRRKPFVIAASLLMAFSMALPLLSPTLIGMLGQMIVGGIAVGIYLPVDQALFIDVLPDKNAAGRDLGIAAMAGNLGQTLGPVVAAQVVALTGGYSMVWVVAGLLALVAAVVIVPVKGVR